MSFLTPKLIFGEKQELLWCRMKKTISLRVGRYITRINTEKKNGQLFFFSPTILG